MFGIKLSKIFYFYLLLKTNGRLVQTIQCKKKMDSMTNNNIN